MKHFLIIFTCLLSGCFVESEVTIEEAGFAEKPVIIFRDEIHYLRYRVSIADEKAKLRRVIFTDSDENGAYYYYSQPISSFEWGQLIERPLIWDEFEEYAKENKVFWKNPDGTTVRLSIINAGTKTENSSFEYWLGPQNNSTGAEPFKPVIGKTPIDISTHSKLSRYNLSLSIVKGSQIKLPESNNKPVTFLNNKLQAPESILLDKDKKYLLAQMHLKKGAKGWRFYVLNARVLGGPLNGAIVHFRDGRIQDSIIDKCTAIYEIPSTYNVSTSNIPFEVVAISAK